MRVRVPAAVGVVAIVLFSGNAWADYSNTFDASEAPFRVDYYGGTTAAPTVTFDSTHNLGGPAGSGSAKFTASLNGTAAGVAFTADAMYPAVTAYNISFDLMVDTASASGAANHGAGYFQVQTRLTDNYNSSDSGYNENLGNPAYDSVAHYGVWEHISIPLGPATTGNGVRAITIQDYNNDSINGTVTYYVDNLVLTTTPTPEPATFGLIGIGGGLLMRRRRQP
ncbi:MAG: hypothetical protein JWM57_1560 [Phycisphaerales bacterium]|nr:hypothetical protein [Phycisphaerales bacterium]